MDGSEAVQRVRRAGMARGTRETATKRRSSGQSSGGCRRRASLEGLGNGRITR